MLFLLTSYVSQLSVEKAMDSKATATMADIVARDSVTAEHGILFSYWSLWFLLFPAALSYFVMRYLSSFDYTEHRTHSIIQWDVSVLYRW